MLLLKLPLLRKKSVLQLGCSVLFLLLSASLHAQTSKKDPYGNSPYTKEYNFTYFSKPKKGNLAEWKKQNSPDDYAHPDFGIENDDTPCHDCVEVLSKRTQNERYYVDNTDPAVFYIQKASGNINYYEKGRWIAVSNKIRPVAPDVYESGFLYEPVGFETARQRTYIKTPQGKVYFNSWTLWTRVQGKETLKAKADWTNYTIGDDGMYIKNIFDGIDAELIVHRGAVKTNFIMKKNAFGTFEELIFKDKFNHNNTNLRLDFSETPGTTENIGPLSVSNQQELIQINSGIIYPKGGSKESVQAVAYVVDKNTMGIVVPFEWINSLIDQHELVIDPLVTGSNTLAQASITGSMYNASCNFTNSCNYPLSVNQPAASTITNVTFSLDYLASGLCWLQDGSMRLSTNGCTSPSAAGFYWFCNGIGGGTCFASNISIYSDIQSCLPAPSCSVQTIPFVLHFFRSCYGATGCSSTCIGASTPLTITIQGRTIELPVATAGGINLTSTTVCQNTSMTVSTNGGQYGAPPYSYNWSFNASGVPSVATGTNPTINFPTAGNQTLYLITTDSCGNTATVSRNITVNPAVTPSVSITANPTGQICSGTSVTFTAVPVNGGTTPVYQWKKNNFNVGTNSSTYTDATLIDGDIITVELTSNAPCSSGPVTSAPYVVQVVSGNPVPDVTNLPPLIAQCAVSIANSDFPTATNLCTGGTITATTADPLNYNTQGTYIITWDYADSNGHTASQTQQIIINDTTAPVADMATLPTVNEQCQVTGITPPTATDNCDGTITGTTTTIFPVTTSTTIVWTFTDNNGNVSTQNQAVTISDTTAPVADLTTLPALNEQCQVSSITPPTATDNCNGTITGTTTATFPITASTTVVWTFTDSNGNSSTQNQSVSINDITAPVADVTTLPAVNEQCQVNSITPPTATDNCNGTITGTTTATFPITASTTVVWTFTDSNGNTATQNQAVVINDTTAPVANLTTLPTVNEQCLVTSITPPTATDNCDGTITGTTSTTFPITASTTITWTFTDNSGNATTQNQSVVVQDTTAPTADILTLPAVNEQCQVTSITPPTATDNCDGTITGTTTATFPITASTTVTWNFTDSSGNTSTQNQTVVISDTTAPVPDLATLPGVNEECRVISITPPTATDNCNGTITGTTLTTFPVTASTTVVWTFTDSNGNTSTQNQTVVINDTTAPVADLATLPAVNEQCQVSSMTPPTATDNCDGTITGTTSTTFPITASTTVVWTFTDNGGNTSTQNQTVIINDTTNPVPDITTLPTLSEQCQVNSITPPTATDNCNGTITGTTSTTFPITASTTIIWTFTDSNGNTTTQNQSVVIQDTNAPVADQTTLPTVNEQCQVTSITPPTATDNCNGTITGTTLTTFPVTASTTVVWTFTDSNGNTSTQNQSVVIQDTTAPVADLTTLPIVNEQCQVNSITPPTATDNCNGTITGTTTVTFPITTSTTVIWTFTDSNGNTSTQNQSVVILDTTAPVADLTTLPTVNEQCQVNSITPPTATDNCNGTITGTTLTTFPITASTTVTWTFTDSNGNASTQNQSVVISDTTAPVADLTTLPTVNEQCQVISITPPTATDNCDGTITGTTSTTFPITASTTVTWTFTDNSGNTSTQNQAVVISDTTAPTADLATLPTVNEQCQVISITPPTATDNCDGTITGTTTTTFPVTTSTTVIWTFTDGSGNSSTQNQSVVINDTNAPVADLATLPTVNEQCQVISMTPPTATDNCDGSITGTTSTVFPITTSTTVTWTFTDSNGNSSTQNQSVVINDITAPVADLATLPTVNEQCQVISITPPTATDNCDGTITGTTSIAFPITASTTITWTFTDNSGNTSTQSQSVVINDTTAPVADLITLPTVNEQCQVTSITPPTATDNCNGTITGTTTTVFPITASTTITWTFIDNNGNTSTQSQSVIVQDTTAPVADITTLPVVNEQCLVTSITPPTATDNCNGTITGTTSTVFPITVSTTVIWTFTDSSGNTVTQSQSVTVQDTTAPVANLATLPAVNAQCQVTSITPPTATDNCDGTITGSTSTTFPITASTTVTWTFTDSNGNASTQNQLVIVQDTIAPVANLATLPIVNEQCRVISMTPPTATDNCDGLITGTTLTVFPITASTTVVWTFTDNSGNTSTQNQSVVIQDTIAPVADLATLPAVSSICQVSSITPPTATDNCNGSVTGVTSTGFPITSSTVVVWTFTDIDGNFSTQTQNVNIIPVSLVITDPAPACESDIVDITQGYITNGSTGNGTLSYWYDSAATDPLPNPSAIDTSGTYYIKSENGNCFDIEAVEVIIKDFPTASVSGDTICENNSGTVTFSGTPNAIITYIVDGSANQFISLDVNGYATLNTPPLTSDSIFELVSVSYPTAPFCSLTLNETATVEVVTPVTDFTYVVSDAFSNSPTITMNPINDNGYMLYQLDNDIPQEFNTFINVSPGNHTITLLDSYGCTYVTKQVTVIDYPKFFTPNGDGHNDYWNIIGLNQPNAKLHIFDRYGKLIKQISASDRSQGWDGTFNGHAVPSTDYWFTLEYEENNQIKTFKSHFSLKR